MRNYIEWKYGVRYFSWGRADYVFLSFAPMTGRVLYGLIADMKAWSPNTPQSLLPINFQLENFRSEVN